MPFFTLYRDLTEDLSLPTTCLQDDFPYRNSIVFLTIIVMSPQTRVLQLMNYYTEQVIEKNIFGLVSFSECEYDVP